MRNQLSAILISAAFMMSGCAMLPRGDLPDKIPPKILPIEKPAASSVVGMSDDFNIDLRGIIDENMFISLPLQHSDPLPDINVQPFSVSNATVFDFMRTILEGSQVSFSIDTEHPGANVVRRSVSATNVSGSLKKVLDTFGDSVGFYYYYTGGVLHITADRQYIAKIPPVNDLFDSLPPMLKTLGATDVLIDKTNRTVTYRASKPAQNKVGSYLKWVRDNKKLIIYETYIAEVMLDDSTDTSIQWNKLSFFGSAHNRPVTVNVAGGSAGSAASGAIGIGAVFTGTHFAMDVLANFLKTQGTVNQISKIPMMLIAGGDTAFRNGGTDFYVSSIGAPTIAANGQVIQGQSTLSPLRTGIDLKLSGDLYDGTVFTKVDMLMTALSGYKTFPAGQGQTMQAPITSDRAVNTTVRVRPGDTIMIAGINYEKLQSTVSGMPVGKEAVVLSDNNRAAQRSELVIVMRPKVIRFSQNVDLNEEKPGEEERGGGK